MKAFLVTGPLLFDHIGGTGLFPRRERESIRGSSAPWCCQHPRVRAEPHCWCKKKKDEVTDNTPVLCRLSCGAGFYHLVLRPMLLWSFMWFSEQCLSLAARCSEGNFGESTSSFTLQTSVISGNITGSSMHGHHTNIGQPTQYVTLACLKLVKCTQRTCRNPVVQSKFQELWILVLFSHHRSAVFLDLKSLGLTPRNLDYFPLDFTKSIFINILKEMPVESVTRWYKTFHLNLSI